MVLLVMVSAFVLLLVGLVVLVRVVVGGNVVINGGAHSGNDTAQLLSMGHLTMTM